MASSQHPTDDGTQTDRDVDASADQDAPVVLPQDAELADIDTETDYLATVASVEGYGVFVGLTPPAASDISGLAHSSELPPLTQPRDFTEGERAVVRFVEERNPGELAFEILYSETTGIDNGNIPATDPTVLREPVSGENGASGGAGSSPANPQPQAAAADSDDTSVKYDTAGDEPAVSDQDDSDGQDDDTGQNQDEPASESDTDPPFMAMNPAINLLKSAVNMLQSGFDATEASQEVKDGGDRVEVTVVLERGGE